MKLKCLLLCSTTLLIPVSGAWASDVVVIPEPETPQYVRVCDTYGAGYFYIPGTETCLSINGAVRYDITGGDNAASRGYETRDDKLYAVKNEKYGTWDNLARFSLKLSTGTETDLGTLKSYAELRFQWKNGNDDKSTGTLRFGYIDLGGLHVGLDESAFVTFPGHLGTVNNDDVILAGGYRTALISYTYAAGNGLSAIVSLEQGNNVDVDAVPSDWTGNSWGGTINNYAPHVVGGLRFAQGWGAITAVSAYDARNKDWAAKLRGDVNVTDRLSFWAMAGYKSNKDYYVNVYNDDNHAAGQIRAISSFYGTWGGDWATWGGFAYKATDQAAVNAQLAFDATKTFAASANIAYQLVPGFTITPEISYTQWNDKKSYLNGQKAVQGMVRFEREF